MPWGLQETVRTEPYSSGSKLAATRYVPLLPGKIPARAIEDSWEQSTL